MKKVLLLFRSRIGMQSAAVPFAAKVGRLLGDDVEIKTAEIGEMLFEVSTNDAKITNPAQNLDVKDFDLVIIRHIGALDAEAHAVAVFCRKHGIKFIDSYLDRIIDDKMSAAFEHYSVGAPLPRTFYGPLDEMIKCLPELGGKAIFKDNRGNKGKLNFVVSSADEMRQISNDNPDVHFQLQEFIPNDCDYRILVLNYKPVFAIRRMAESGSHLNNTSQGGAAEIVPLENMNEAILDMAIKVSRVEGLEVSGVDVVIDNTNGKFYILEVNHAPMISSGSFQDEKAKVYANMIAEILSGE
jgi:glutathione synthase/RimK-type ligase-like ATP-grasp enzyme